MWSRYPSGSHKQFTAANAGNRQHWSIIGRSRKHATVSRNGNDRYWLTRNNDES
jgi:hypothetical protein